MSFSAEESDRSVRPPRFGPSIDQQIGWRIGGVDDGSGVLANWWPVCLPEIRKSAFLEAMRVRFLEMAAFIKGGKHLRRKIGFNRHALTTNGLRQAPKSTGSCVCR
jgi:hypothetical protein